MRKDCPELNEHKGNTLVFGQLLKEVNGVQISRTLTISVATSASLAILTPVW